MLQFSLFLEYLSNPEGCTLNDSFGELDACGSKGLLDGANCCSLGCFVVYSVVADVEGQIQEDCVRACTGRKVSTILFLNLDYKRGEPSIVSV
jgi:hypothetical protein